MSNHYETLGVAKDATLEEIKKAYRKKVSKSHSDTNKGASDEETAKINVAYEVLSDEERRKNYDVTGENKVDNLLVDAQALIMQKVMVWLKNTTNVEAPMIPVLMQQFEQDRMSVVKTKEGGLLILARLRRAIEKLKYKGEAKDYIKEMIEGQITSIEEQLERVENDFKRIDLAKMLLQSYEYGTGEWPTISGYTHHRVFLGGGSR